MARRKSMRDITDQGVRINTYLRQQGRERSTNRINRIVNRYHNNIINANNNRYPTGGYSERKYSRSTYMGLSVG